MQIVSLKIASGEKGAAEVRSAEAMQLPVRKKPPASVANGFCHPLGCRKALKLFPEIGPLVYHVSKTARNRTMEYPLLSALIH